MDESMKQKLDALNSSSMKTALEAMKKTSESLNSIAFPKITMPEFNIPRMADLQLHKLPTQEEVNEYQSAGILMRRLADTILQWRDKLPETQQPAIVAFLYGGIQINVERLAQESFHGIRIEGKMNGNPCMMLAHQSTVQLLCYVENVEKEEFKRKIGFIIDGEEKEI
jgi:hypothetical protein